MSSTRFPLNGKKCWIHFQIILFKKSQNKEETNVIFICTHNSRRSQLAQVWAKTSAEYFGIENINCYSGGTETTAFYPTAVISLEKVGFEIVQENKDINPVYSVKYSESQEAIKCFSKVYDDDFNPNEKFITIMTCSNADENCPVILGAEKRFPIRFEDPKIFDNTELEDKKYAEKCSEIAREMLFVFSKINNRLT